MYKIIIHLIVTVLLLSSCTQKQEGKHLFILSGQSNMARLDPVSSFIPTVQESLGENSIIVVKDAKGGQPIRRWYQDWRAPTEGGPSAQPDLYDSLMVKVNTAIQNEKLATVTFIWMQGERDARESLGKAYEEGLTGLYYQISQDLGREDVNFIIGRLSDFDLANAQYPHWTMIRGIQVKIGESDPRFAWVNTDDLNDGLNDQGHIVENDLHMSVTGYKILGERFANAAIRLVKGGK